jgi:hypothetical protein
VGGAERGRFRRPLTCAGASRAIGLWRAGPVAGHGLRLRRRRLRGVSRATCSRIVFARQGASAGVAVRGRLRPSRPQLLRRFGAPVLSAGVSRHRGLPPRWRADVRARIVIPTRDAAGGGAPGVVGRSDAWRVSRNGSASSPSVGGRDGDGAAVADLLLGGPHLRG